MFSLIVTGAFFCYGMYTLQRKGFLLDQLPNLWKKLPTKFHEPLFDCGVCVSSVWGIFFIVSQWILKHVVPHKYLEIASIPIYIISMCGICAVIDRAVKFFEYGYNYKKTRDKDIAERGKIN
jgi:hypothetical protein